MPSDAVDIALAIIHASAGDPKRAPEAAALIQGALDAAGAFTAADLQIRALTAAMGNVLAWRLGEICNQAARDPNAGDYIDRGLILRRLLEEKGFHLVYREPPREITNDSGD